MTLTLQKFADSVECTLLHASSWHEHFLAAIAEFKIDSAIELAQFLAQVGHESSGLSRLTENLDYSAERLVAVWPKRFATLTLARMYAHQPEDLANYVYASRNGNGSTASGDGWRYRGRGPKQITFADNYRQCGRALNLSLISEPDLLLEKKIGARSAAWFWASRGCKATCDDCKVTTRKINGGENGIADRTRRFEKNKKLLGVSPTT